MQNKDQEREKGKVINRNSTKFQILTSKNKKIIRDFRQFSIPESVEPLSPDSVQINDNVELVYSQTGCIQKITLIKQPPQKPQQKLPQNPPSIQPIPNLPNKQIVRPQSNYSLQSISCIKVPLQCWADILSIRYSQFRRVKTDQKSFYRAAGISILQLCQTPILGKELRSKVQNLVRKSIQFFCIEEIVKDRINKVMELFSNNLHPWRISQELKQKLEDPFFDKGIVAFSQLLMSYSIYQKQQSETIKMLFGQNTEQIYRQIWDQYLAQEFHINFLAEGLGISIVLVSIENGLKTLEYNPENRVRIHLLGMNGSYSVLMTRVQNVFLKHQNNIDKLRTFVQNFELQAYSRQEKQLIQYQKSIEKMKIDLKKKKGKYKEVKLQLEKSTFALTKANQILIKNAGALKEVQGIIQYVDILKDFYQDILQQQSVQLQKMLDIQINFKEFSCSNLEFQYAYIQKAVAQAQAEVSPQLISQCPSCFFPNIFQDDQRILCANQNCQTQFCFDCACLRNPVLEHGNHYHRPQCKFYQNQIQGIGYDEYRKNCTQCQKAGRLCERPKDLKIKRRFHQEILEGSIKFIFNE